MSKICQTIKDFLKTYHISGNELTYLVAFSGGYDSMCLAHALKKVSANRIVAIHLNHKWRGEESDNEEENCRRFCNSIGIEFYSESLPQTVPHTETAAREARYKFFEKCAIKFGSQIVFTAHNKNDNVETVIYRIAKGSGILGLKGISKFRGIFYRPLLGVTRKEIEGYIQENHLVPNVDSSNYDTKYKRNFIRSKLLPMFNEVSNNSFDSIASLIDIANEETEIIDEYLCVLRRKISVGGRFDTAKFLKQSLSVQNRLIYNIFVENNLDYDRKKIHSIREFIEDNSVSKSGRTCSLTTDMWLFASEKFFEVISAEKVSDLHLEIKKEGIYETEDFVFQIEKFSKPVRKFPKDSENIAFVNLKNFELDFQLRYRECGDVITPYGMKGSQKLKKYLNAKKIPNHEKNNLVVLAQGDEILWVCGYGISNKIKVLSEATHRLKFERKKGLNGD